MILKVIHLCVDRRTIEWHRVKVEDAEVNKEKVEGDGESRNGRWLVEAQAQKRHLTLPKTEGRHCTNGTIWIRIMQNHILSRLGSEMESFGWKSRIDACKKQLSRPRSWMQSECFNWRRRNYGKECEETTGMRNRQGQG